MTNLTWRHAAGAGLCALAALTVSHVPACAQQPAPAPVAPAPAQVMMSLQRRAPAGAVVLLGSGATDMADNWYMRYSKTPCTWPLDAEGVTSTAGKDITSVREFGDCQLHMEFRSLPEAHGKKSGGNAGVGLQGRYEVQILSSYGRALEKHMCGSIYSQTAPRVNACRPAGEWQTYDIIFRAPRLDAAGAVVEKPRITVFQNGILIHVNREVEGPTGIQYGEFKGMPATGPIVLQGDHDPVQYRNIWVVEL